MSTQNPAVRSGRIVRQSSPDLQSQLESLLSTVWACERMERNLDRWGIFPVRRKVQA